MLLPSTNYDRCPDQRSFEPCKCYDDNHEIQCGPGVSVAMNLLYLFRESIPKSTFERNQFYHYQHLILENSSLDSLLNDSFNRFVFDAISIRNNYYLSHLEPDLLNSTATITKSLTLHSNRNLLPNEQSVITLFSIISSLIQLETLIINDCGLYFIPNNAFITLKQLTRLYLQNNLLKTIESNTFNNLYSLRILDLSHNIINNLPADSLKLSINDGQCYDSFRRNDIHYFIDLSHNNLSSQSFHSNTFDIRCSLELKLTHNQIEYLNEYCFRSLFRYYTMIELYDNPFDCHHCNQSWLMMGRFCSDYNTITRYWMVIDFLCRDNHQHHMSLDYFIVNCTKYATKLQQLDYSFNNHHHTNSLLLNKFFESYPDEFLEQDTRLLRCESDFNVKQNSVNTPQLSRILHHIPSSPYFILLIVSVVVTIILIVIIQRQYQRTSNN